MDVGATDVNVDLAAVVAVAVIEVIKSLVEASGYKLMQCFSPISIKEAGQDDPRKRVQVPCGRCAACLSNRRMEWATRLEQELKVSETAHFLTITYSEDNLPYGDLFATLDKQDIQLWMKRLRKRLKGRKIKYYLVGEYGTHTVRPHYHAIMFNLPHFAEKLKLVELLVDTWDKGMIDVGTVTPASIRYVLKYVMQTKEKNPLHDYVEKPFALMSKNLGISYVDKHRAYHHADVERNYVVKEGGNKTRLPRYYRDKIYDKHQKQKQREIYEEKRRDIERSSEPDRLAIRTAHEYKGAYTARVERSLKKNQKF